MVVLWYLAVAGLIVGLQFLQAAYLDSTLPKQKKLPLWLRGGPAMEKRWWALHAHPCLSAFVAALLLIVAISQHLEPKPVRTDGEMIAAFGFALTMFSLLHLHNVWRIKRWFRKGRPLIGK